MGSSSEKAGANPERMDDKCRPTTERFTPFARRKTRVTPGKCPCKAFIEISWWIFVETNAGIGDAGRLQPMRLGAADIAGANAAGKSAFAAEVEPVVRRLRGALHALIVSLPQPVRRGPDLQRQLGIANTMAWKIHSFVESTELLTAAAQLPGREAVRRMLDAATAKGVRPPDHF